jgi:hypothetical protein
MYLETPVDRGRELDEVHGAFEENWLWHERQGTEKGTRPQHNQVRHKLMEGKK